MKPRERSNDTWAFAGATGAWLLGLFVVIAAYQFLGTAHYPSWSFVHWSLGAPAIIGLLLPFSVFAGGLALGDAGTGLRRAALHGVVPGLASYLLLAFGAPLGQYQSSVLNGVDVPATQPAGPQTPGVLWSLREAIRRDPPEVYSLRVNQPFRYPPNWLTYLLHSPVVFSLFTVLGVVLGRRIAHMTSGLSPPARKNSRWGLGVLAGVTFFAVEALGNSRVLADPSVSGLIAAWIALLPPLLMLALVELLARRRGLHASPERSVE